VPEAVNQLLVVSRWWLATNTQPDIQGATLGADNRHFSVKSEPKGNGSGRIYTATYAATDASGNTATTSAIVLVPKH
jgi:endo-1,4-beta-xylanase